MKDRKGIASYLFFAKGLPQRPRSVGGQGPGAVAQEPLRSLGVIDGPDVVLISGFAQPLDEGSVDGPVGIGGETIGSRGLEEGEGLVGGGREAPALAIMRDDEHRLALWLHLLPSSHEINLEGDDHDLFRFQFARGQVASQGGDDLGPAFDLNEDGLVLGHGGEDLGQSGDAGPCELGVLPLPNVERLQFLQGGARYHLLLPRDLLGIVVVDADDVAILGKVEVALDGVSPEPPSELEGGEGVLGREVGGPTMCDEEEGDDELNHQSR